MMVKRTIEFKECETVRRKWPKKINRKRKNSISLWLIVLLISHRKIPGRHGAMSGDDLKIRKSIFSEMAKLAAAICHSDG